MQEAINLSGIFIDKGPLSILKFKDNSNYTIRDPKRGSFFNKPIAVIVNQYSASASEFFAAAMQDYKRAIIVGSKTFGKGTAQNIMPLKENTDLGFAKITVETFFRVSGASHQEIGIIPDVKLPSVYQKINDNEATKPFVIKNDTVTARLKVLQLKQKDLKPIITSSNLRISRNDLFVTVNEQSDLLYNYVNKSQESYKLTLANIKAITKKRKSILDKVFTINENVLFTIKNTASTLEILSYNEDSKKENDYILQELSKDIYINETYNILNDYINLN